MDNPILLITITKKHTCSKILNLAEKDGVHGGTIVKAEGTVKDKFLHALGIHETDREVLLIVVEAETVATIYHKIEIYLSVEKKTAGIVFSVNLSSFSGNKHLNYTFQGSDYSMDGRQLIVTIVDRELGDDVVEAARKKGAVGATIIHGRGTSTDDVGRIFNIRIEPEKEVVLMVVDNNHVAQIISNIQDTMKIEEPGKGILFTIPIDTAAGLQEENKIE